MCVCTLWNISRTRLLYSKLKPLSPPVTTTTDQREITTKQFVSFGFTSHLRNHQGHADTISQPYSGKLVCFIPWQDLCKAEHITRIYFLNQKLLLHHFMTSCDISGAYRSQMSYLDLNPAVSAGYVHALASIHLRCRVESGKLKVSIQLGKHLTPTKYLGGRRFACSRGVESGSYPGQYNYLLADPV